MSALPHENFATASNGDLFRNSDNRVVREKYAYTFSNISSGKELCSTLRAGEYAWPGGYPLYFIAGDGESLHFKCVKENLYSCIYSIRHSSRDGWDIVGCEVNYEDEEMMCGHCGDKIESAYGG